jgi:hypothetical protein
MLKLYTEQVTTGCTGVPLPSDAAKQAVEEAMGVGGGDAEPIYDMLFEKLGGKLSDDEINDLACSIVELVNQARREGREDGLWEA